MKTYTIKIKSKEALIQARNDNPLSGVIDDEDADRYADQIFTNCRKTSDIIADTLYLGGYDNGKGIFVAEEIEWIKENN